jgi:hypothetical protein
MISGRGCRQLKAEIVTVKIAPQLYASICGIQANIGEAYSRSSRASAGDDEINPHFLGPKSSISSVRN